jgi:hypothetical protein
MARDARRTVEGWLYAVVRTKRWSKSALASKPTITVQEIQLIVVSSYTGSAQGYTGGGVTRGEGWACGKWQVLSGCTVAAIRP